ncbi:MAG: hypothetical protein GX585_01075, partial [Clostridiales bacterium]|nr:hypothetical protein [Clostridiales bacterium]
APYWPHKITQGAALAPERAAERLEQLPGVRADEAPAPPEQTKKVIDKGERRTYIDWKEHRDTFTDDQRDVLLALSDGPLPVNELIERTQLAARRVLSALTLLQVGGFVAEGPGKRFTSSVLLRMD